MVVNYSVIEKSAIALRHPTCLVLGELNVAS